MAYIVCEPIKKAVYYSIFRYLMTFILLLSSPCLLYSQDTNKEPLQLGNYSLRSVYQNEGTEILNENYNRAWGIHYKRLYYKPISVQTIPTQLLVDNFSLIEEIPQFHSIILSKNDTKKIYLIRPLGGSSCFLESSFFRDVYHKADFKDTYLGDFIADAYTIVHPYAFMASDHLAASLGLISSKPSLVYISSPKDSVISEEISNRMVSISEIPLTGDEVIISTVDSLLSKLNGDEGYFLNQRNYIRTRLFDMIIGNWNKIPDSWLWIGKEQGDSTIIEPVEIDRNHAFTKVDGLLFKGLLQVLGLNFIQDYNKNSFNTNKLNTLGYPLDMALTQKEDLSVWLTEAHYIQDILTDQRIDDAFSMLPKEIQDKDTKTIKESLMTRRDLIEEITTEYYKSLQKTPSITGTNGNDHYIICDAKEEGTQILIYNQRGELLLNKTYLPSQTKEIWLYGLEGDDRFEVKRKNAKIPILVIGGRGNNRYEISNKNNITLYEYKEQKERLNSVSVRKVYPNNEVKVLEYDYEKLRHTKFDVTPIGIYDSDLGLNIGTSLAYTVYGFRRAPYTRRHQLSWDYVNGFTYQGIFPDYDSKRSFHLSAYAGGIAYFSNFFGYGNQTFGYKHEKKNYNRVKLSRYMLTPAFYYTINKSQSFNLYSSVQIYKVKNPKGKDRFINSLYEDDNDIFKTKYFLELGAAYKLNVDLSSFAQNFNAEFSTGWIINIAKPERNVPYTKLDLGVNLTLSDLLTFATLLKGTVLYTNNYEFYQSATTELRGFRNNRFIGRQSLYQYSDLRLDMGKINNPFAPLSYGIFLGSDHGRVWHPGEVSNKWHSSYGGGIWLTLFSNFTGKFSYFASKVDGRFTFQLGMDF